MTALDADLDRFVERIRLRLQRGAREHGNRSFTRPLGELVEELMAETEDIAGWGLLLWSRLDRLRRRVERIGGQGGNDG